MGGVTHITGESDRIQSLDVLRGFAVLGILLMNVQSFSMIEAAYANPTAHGRFEGINQWVWGFTRLFADLKFMTLFSVLFGAGIALMGEKAIATGRRPAALHYRRMFFLLLVGVAHAYLLWFGDILTIYALCGMVVYLFRRWQPSILFALGGFALLIPSALFLLMDVAAIVTPEEVLPEIKEVWSPGPETIAWQLELYRGGYWGQMELRVPTAWQMHTFMLVLWFGWRVSGLMLIGMALFKWGVITGQKSGRAYWRLLLVGAFTGLALELSGMFYQISNDWSTRVMVGGLHLNYWASMFMAAAYMAGVMLMGQAGCFPKVQSALGSVGRMAFTNYLAQTVICTTIFYGHGLGLFGRVERWGQLLIVLVIWAVQIGWSVWWLNRFQMGPLEWLWRCVTYLKVPRMRIMPVGSEEPVGRSVVP